MVKITINETTKKYDKDGKLVEEIARTEIAEDDTLYYSKLYTPNNSDDCFIPTVKKVLYGKSEC